MINTQTLIDRMVAELDAEGSDRYLFDQDFKPAINTAIDWLVAVFNKAFADNKLNEEVLSELTYVKIWQASQFSRIKVDPAILGHPVWTIVNISPEPETYPAATPPTQLLPERSVLRTDLSFVKSNFSAERKSKEKWDKNRNNIFESGNEVMTGSFKRYAYLNPFNYSSSNYSVAGEIEIRPSVAGKFVAISYLKYPSKVNVSTDNIEFPETLTDILFQKALNYISFKQGDRTSLFTVTANDVNQLAQLMQ